MKHENCARNMFDSISKITIIFVIFYKWNFSAAMVELIRRYILYSDTY